MKKSVLCDVSYFQEASKDRKVGQSRYRVKTLPDKRKIRNIKPKKITKIAKKIFEDAYRGVKNHKKDFWIALYLDAGVPREKKNEFAVAVATAVMEAKK